MEDLSNIKTRADSIVLGRYSPEIGQKKRKEKESIELMATPVNSKSLTLPDPTGANSI